MKKSRSLIVITITVLIFQILCCSVLAKQLPGSNAGFKQKQVSPYVIITARLGGVEEGRMISGTNVEISGFCSTSGIPTGDPIPPTAIAGARVRSVGLYIDGVLVNQWNCFDPGQGPPQSTKARFASTWFPNNYNCEITTVGIFDLQESQYIGSNIYSGTETITVTVTPKVYNSAQVYQESQFGGLTRGGARKAKAHYDSMNHNTSNYAVDNNWTKSSYLGAFSLSTSVYSGTHGWNGPPAYIEAEETRAVESTQGDTTVITIEHLNITQSELAAKRAQAYLDRYPPINFAFFDACLVGGNYDFCKEVLFPTSDTVIDRCTFGFAVSIQEYAPTDLSGKYTEAFYTRLSSFGTASQARLDAIAAYNLYYLGDQEPLSALDFVIVGDPATRLWGVYTGDNSVSPDVWFLKL